MKTNGHPIVDIIAALIFFFSLSLWMYGILSFWKSAAIFLGYIAVTGLIAEVLAEKYERDLHSIRYKTKDKRNNSKDTKGG